MPVNIERLEAAPQSEPGKRRLYDPLELMRDNPAALIVNKDMYDRMAAHFAEDQFEPPQVVDVETYSAEHGAVIKPFVLDGMTRTKFAADHQRQSNGRVYDFSLIETKDVTTSVIQNPLVVPANERKDGQTALTMMQYLRAVIPPTVEHAQIATDRIAAHLINGWDNIVGEELAGKYSAIAALSFLASDRVPTATDKELKKFLAQQEELIAHAAPAETTKLREGFRKMAAIIRESRLRKRELANAAFLLVGSGSEVIGGEHETKKQVHGLLYLPEVEAKLVAAYPRDRTAQRELARIELGQFIIDAIHQHQQDPRTSINEVMGVLIQALRHKDFSLDHAVGVVSSHDPAGQMDTFVRDVNEQKLRNAYMTMYKMTDLSDQEVHFLSQFGRVTTLDERQLGTLVNAIEFATQTLTQTDKQVTEWENTRSWLMRQGVNEETLNQGFVTISSDVQRLLSATTDAALSMARRRLDSDMTSTRANILREQSAFKINKLINAHGGDIVRNSQNPAEVVGNLTAFVFKFIDRNNPQGIDEKLVQAKLNQLAKLDADLQERVLNREGGITLQLALQLQEERDRRALITAFTVPDVTPPPPSSKPSQRASYDASPRQVRPAGRDPLDTTPGNRVLLPSDEAKAAQVQWREYVQRRERDARTITTVITGFSKLLRETQITFEDLPEDVRKHFINLQALMEEFTQREKPSIRHFPQEKERGDDSPKGTSSSSK